MQSIDYYEDDTYNNDDSQALYKIQNEQRDLARIISTKLALELKPYFLSDTKRLEGYIYEQNGYFDTSTDYDNKTLIQEFEDELHLHAQKAVQGYTAWLANKLIKNSSQQQNLPSENEIEYEQITKQYNLPPLLLRRVVKELHKQDYIPLIGRIKNGQIILDK